MRIGDKFALYSRYEGFIRIVTIDEIVNEGDGPLDRYALTECGVRVHLEKEDDRHYSLLDKNVWIMPATAEDIEDDEFNNMMRWLGLSPQFENDRWKVYQAYKDRLIAAKETIEAFKKSWKDGFVF